MAIANRHVTLIHDPHPFSADKMNMNTAPLSSFLLIDGAMLGDADAYVPLAQDVRPNWVIPIYEDAELVSMSPLVIDIDAAQRAWPVDQMMAMLNAIRPQQHASIIDTSLDHGQLARHLRRFSFIAVEGGVLRCALPIAPSCRSWLPHSARPNGRPWPNRWPVGTCINAMAPWRHCRSRIAHKASCPRP